MKKDNDFFMVSNWTDRDDTAPMVILMDSGFCRRDASAIIFHLLWCLYQVSDDGVRPAQTYRRWLAELNFSKDEIDGILSTAIFEPVDGDANNLYFSPYARQVQGIIDYKAKADERHERAVARGKVSALVPNKGRFKPGHNASGNASSKPQEKVEEQKVESVEVEEKVEEQKVESVEVEEKVEENKVETEGRKDSRELLRTYAQTMRQSIEERENAIPQRVYRGQAAFLASLRKEREAED